MPNIEQLKHEQSTIQQKADRLSKQRDQKTTRLASIEAELNSLAFAAHAEEDSHALKQMKKLANDRDELREEIQSIGSVISSLEAKASHLANEIAHENLRTIRENAQQLFNKQAEAAKEIIRAVNSLVSKMQAVQQRDLEIVAVLSQLSLGMTREAKYVQRIYRHVDQRVQWIIAKLNRALRPGSTIASEIESMDLVALELGTKDAVLIATNNLPLTREQGDKNLQSFRVLQNISGLGGNELTRGQSVWLDPNDGEVAELVNAGALAVELTEQSA